MGFGRHWVRRHRRRVGGERPRPPRRLRYGLYRALLLVALLVIPSCVESVLRDEAQRLVLDRATPHTYGAPSIPNTLPAHPVSHQVAPPSASGAEPPYPRNHTFDAELIPLGAQANADFETPGATAFMFAVVTLLFFLLAVFVNLITRNLQCLGFGLGSCSPQSVSVPASLTQVFSEGKQVIDMAVGGGTKTDEKKGMRVQGHRSNRHGKITRPRLASTSTIRAPSTRL
jgi:hypothetical protein